MTFEQVQKRFNELKNTKEVMINVHPKIRGVIIGLLDKACGSKENRYQFSIALGLPPHSKDWTAQEWYAIGQIVKVDRDPAIGWMSTEPNFHHIIGAVMAKVGANENQIPLFSEETK